MWLAWIACGVLLTLAVEAAAIWAAISLFAGWICKALDPPP